MTQTLQAEERRFKTSTIPFQILLSSKVVSSRKDTKEAYNTALLLTTSDHKMLLRHIHQLSDLPSTPKSFFQQPSSLLIASLSHESQFPLCSTPTKSHLQYRDLN